ncbi:MAG: sensor histidine kinase, partial [Leptospiraceae bacterium]|nr:sensor histidine kinase [Leptospiraceae bacterium]
MKQISLRTLSAIAWLFLSLSLGGWWTVMGIRTAGDIARLKSELGLEKFENVKEDLERKQRMIKLEGISFLFLISIGGLTIIFMSIRDERKNKILKEFFATVTHEMKT